MSIVSSRKIRIRQADIRDASVLAHQVTLGRIIMENGYLRSLYRRPRKYYTDAIAGLHGRHRDLALQSMIVWIHWGELMNRALHAGEPDERTHKRMTRARRCSPSAVMIKAAEFYYRCENYICPMCWYRHVRQRLLSIDRLVANSHLGTAVHVQGALLDTSQELPSKDDLASMYDLAARLRNAVAATGSLASVRLLGGPGAWKLATEAVLLGVTPKDVRARVQAHKEAEWHVVPIRPQEGAKRGRSLLLTMASSMEYPMGIFHKGLKASELQTLFIGRRVIRSRTTGILACPMDDRKQRPGQGP